MCIGVLYVSMTYRTCIFLGRILIVIWLTPLRSLEVVGSRFHQTDYKVVPDRIVVVGYNHSYAKEVNGGLSWYNRSQRVINAHFTLLQFVSSDVKMDIQVYKFLSNEYRFFPISLLINPCHHLDQNTLGSQDFLKKFANQHSCPVKPGIYYVRNGIPDFEQFPPNMPAGIYKAAVKLYHKDDFVTQVDLYGAVETYITKWEH